MPHNEEPASADWRLTTFDGARREQLRRWSRLPLEDILRAIEEMHDLARQLGEAPAIPRSPMAGESVVR